MDTLELSRADAAPPVPVFPRFNPRAPWWGGDLQTLRNFLIRRYSRLDAYPSQRLRLVLGDGDVLLALLNWPLADGPRRPLTVLVHGLTGCEESFYILNTASHLLALGYPVVRLNLRGAGPSRPFCRFQYHAGRSEDFAAALAALPPALGATGIVAVGYSLGASMLLKYLGEHGSKAALKAAISVSAPLDLAECSRHFLRRRNMLYQNYLLKQMKLEATAPGAEVTAAERAAIGEARSIWDFDHKFSAPRNGFKNAEDYYERNGAKRFLDGIGVPTLVIHALDDPWIPPTPYVSHQWGRNSHLLPLLSERGGHVGFQGSDPHIAWHDLCIARFLGQV